MQDVCEAFRRLDVMAGHFKPLISRETDSETTVPASPVEETKRFWIWTPNSSNARCHTVDAREESVLLDPVYAGGSFGLFAYQSLFGNVETRFHRDGSCNLPNLAG